MSREERYELTAAMVDVEVAILERRFFPNRVSAKAVAAKLDRLSKATADYRATIVFPVATSVRVTQK